MNIDLKRFKNTEEKKFFVSNTLKIISSSFSFIELEDSMEQKWKIKIADFCSFIIANKIKIENNILEEYLVIDKDSVLCLAKEYDAWLDEYNKSEIIKKNDLIVGNAYLLETGLEVIFLGTYYYGAFDVLYSYDGRNNTVDLKYSNIYKKDLFIKRNSISGTDFHSKDFISNNKDKFVKKLDLKLNSEEVESLITVWKLKNLFYYFSKEKDNNSIKKIKLKKISEEELYLLYSLGNKHLTVFRKHTSVYTVYFKKLFTTYYNQSFLEFKDNLRQCTSFNGSSKICFDENLDAIAKTSLSARNKEDLIDSEEYYILDI